jgi:hypothetical protein
MGRPSYVCTTCSEHFTRKYSAKRHNITVHRNNGGEIIPLVEYLVGRNTGRYQASHPSWHRRSEKSIHKFGRAMVADSIGSTLRLGGLQRQQQAEYQHQQQSLEEQERYHRQQQEQSLSPSIPPSPAAIEDQPPDVLPYPTDLTFQTESMGTTYEELTTLSQETILKIEELKRLIYRYSQCHRNPGAVINCIIYYCNNGDNILLDEKLEQLRMIDSVMGYPRM